MQHNKKFLLLLLTPVSVPAFSAANSSLEQIDVYESITSQSKLYSPSMSYVGTKVAAPLTRTPVGVTVITEKQIQDRNAQDIADSLVYTAGLLGSYRGKNNELEIMVRGIGNKSDGGGVPTYLNGIAYQGSYEMDPFFLESINVIKGPASVLYGQANPGGIVDIVTKKPTKTDRNLLQLKAGSKDYYQAGLDIERKLNDQLSFRLLGNIKRLHWKENYTEEQGGALAPSFTWTPNKDTELTLYAFYQKYPKAGQRNFLLREGTLEAVNGAKIPYDFFAGDPDYHKLTLEQYHTGSQFSHRFNDMFSFRQNIRYSKSQRYLRGLIAWSPVAGKTEIERKARIFDDRWHEFGADNQLETKFATGELNHTLLSGVEYKQSRYDLKAYLGPAASIDWTHPLYGVSVAAPSLQSSYVNTIKQTGVYLQDQIEFGNWDFLVGGRYDWVRNRNNVRYGAINDYRQKDHKFTWRTGAIYNFANGIAPYLSYSTSFQPEVGVDGHSNPLKPTTAKQYEVGIKYQPSENMLFTTALYRIIQRNLVTTDYATFEKSQTGETRTKGIEVSLAADLNENINLIASYAYTNREITKDKNTALVGKTPWGVPRHQGALWAKYSWHKGPLEGLNLGAGVRYIGTTQGNNYNDFSVPHYTLYDMTLGYDLTQLNAALKGAEIQLNVNNLTDKKYVASCANAYTCFYGSERTLVVTFNYQW